jgi:hypothetical protein
LHHKNTIVANIFLEKKKSVTHSQKKKKDEKPFCREPFPPVGEKKHKKQIVLFIFFMVVFVISQFWKLVLSQFHHYWLALELALTITCKHME